MRRALVLASYDVPIETVPRSVNLTALVRRLSRICRRRVGSPHQVEGRFGLRDIDTQGLPPGVALYQVSAGLDQRAELERHDLERKLAGLHLGEVEHVVDDRQQRSSGITREAEIPPLLASQGRIVVQQVVDAEDAGQRRPQLVAHIGQELGLDPCRRFRRCLGAFEVASDPLALAHVAQRADHRRRRPGGRLPHEIESGLDPDPVSVLVAEPVGRRSAVAGEDARDDAVREGPDGGRVVGVDEMGWPVSQHLIRRIAEHRPACGRDVDAPEVEIELGYHVARRIGQHPVLRLAVPNGVFGSAPRRDVGVGPDHAASGERASS